MQEEHAPHPHHYATERSAVKVLIPSGSFQRYSDDLVGKSVGFVRSMLEEDELISGPLVTLVNGQAVSDDYVLSRGELLEFMRGGAENSRAECNGDPKL